MNRVHSTQVIPGYEFAMEGLTLAKARELDELTQALEAARRALAARDGDQVLQAPAVEELELAHRRTIQAANRVGEQLMRDRVELGDIAVGSMNVGLAQLLEELGDELQPGSSSERAQLEIDAAGNLNAFGDPELLRRPLRGLLRAALSAVQRHDSVEITARRSGDEIVISLQIEGRDLPAMIAPHLLPARTDPDSEFIAEPLDMDRLALRPFVEAMQGRVWIEDLDDTTPALRIALPGGQEEDPAPVEVAAASTVLIVDDDPDGAFMLEQVLAKGGYETLIAHDGLKGLQIAKSEQVGLILLDVMLPGLDGFEVCRRLRAEQATAKVPIIMISAKSRPEDRETGLKMGADDYMSKPLRLAEVLDKIGELLGEPGRDR